MLVPVGLTASDQHTGFVHTWGLVAWWLVAGSLLSHHPIFGKKGELSSPQHSVNNVQVRKRVSFFWVHPEHCIGQEPSRWPSSADKGNPIHDITFCTTAAWIKEGFLVLETP